MEFLTVIGALAAVLGGSAAGSGQAAGSVEPPMPSVSSAGCVVATVCTSAGVQLGYTELRQLARGTAMTTGVGVALSVDAQMGASFGTFATMPSAAVAAPDHRFHCNRGYTIPACEEQLKRLKRILSSMDMAQLGDWTWILVQSDDWESIKLNRGLDPDSPAFSILEKRLTVLEEALFNPTPGRSRTLLAKWHVLIDQLLLIAVAHELAHALCRETDEVKTVQYTEELRRTGRVTCTTDSVRSQHTPHQ